MLMWSFIMNFIVCANLDLACYAWFS